MSHLILRDKVNIVDTLVLPVLLVLLGYLLREYSAQKQAKSDMEMRWDREKRALYAEYLAAADSHHNTLRQLATIEHNMEDPRAYWLSLFDDESDTLTPQEIDAQVERLESYLREERSELWQRRDEGQRKLKELESQMEILTDRYTRVMQMGLGISFGEDDYREHRKRFLERVRDDLQVPDRWPVKKRSRWSRVKSRLKKSE